MSGRISNKIVQNGLVFYIDATNTKSYIIGDTIWKDLTLNQANCISTGTTVYDSGNLGSVVFNSSTTKIIKLSND